MTVFVSEGLVRPRILRNRVHRLLLQVFGLKLRLYFLPSDKGLETGEQNQYTTEEMMDSTCEKKLEYLNQM